MQVREKCYFLSRPRRFGKTLLIDTMEEFFNLSGRQELFENTEIYQQHPGGWLRYPTIRLDFSKTISTDDSSAFRHILLKKLKDVAEDMNTYTAFR